MELVSIFTNPNPSLYAVKYPNEEEDEFTRLFDLWNDIIYLEDFFEKNKCDLKSGFFGGVTIEEAIKSTRNEAKWLEKELLKLAELSSNERNSALDTLFKPLDNFQSPMIVLSKNKAKGNTSKSWLRIYAIRIEKDLYVVTGGAIKLTKTMQERPHTVAELQKLDKVRDYLKNENLIDDTAFEQLEI